MQNAPSGQLYAAQDGASAPLLNVGLIGTGRISDIYLQTCTSFPDISIATCGSLDLEESHRKAVQYGIPKVASPEDIIADDSIDCVLNLTIPAVHA